MVDYLTVITQRVNLLIHDLDESSVKSAHEDVREVRGASRDPSSRARSRPNRRASFFPRSPRPWLPPPLITPLVSRRDHAGLGAFRPRRRVPRVRVTPRARERRPRRRERLEGRIEPRVDRARVVVRLAPRFQGRERILVARQRPRRRARDRLGPSARARGGHRRRRRDGRPRRRHRVSPIQQLRPERGDRGARVRMRRHRGLFQRSHRADARDGRERARAARRRPREDALQP